MIGRFSGRPRAAIAAIAAALCGCSQPEPPIEKPAPAAWEHAPAPRTVQNAPEPHKIIKLKPEPESAAPPATPPETVEQTPPEHPE